MTPLCPHPPTVDQLCTALAQLPAAPDLYRAALHLATPVDRVFAEADDPRPSAVAPGSQEGIAHSGATTSAQPGRAGQMLGSGGPSAVREIAAMALAHAQTLVSSPREGAPVFLDLAGEPYSWVKLVRSGARHVVFGAYTLFGAPLAAAEEGVGAAVVSLWLREWALGRLPSPPTVLPVADGGAVIVDGTRARVVLRRAAQRSAEGSPAADGMDLGLAVVPMVAGPERFAAVTDQVRSLLGGLRGDYAIRGARWDGTIDLMVHVRLDDEWTAHVPVTLSPTTTLLGYQSSETSRRTGPAPLLDACLPDGFSATPGTATCRADGTLERPATHDRSLVATTLTRTTCGHGYHQPATNERD